VIRVFDFIIVAAGTVLIANRNLFLGSVVFCLCVLFEFQMRRTRLLIGEPDRKVTSAKMVKACVLGLVLTALLLPLLPGATSGSFDSGNGDRLGWSFPVSVLAGIFSAMLMLSVSAERRKR
jgi:hypothetical protein